LNLHAAAYLHGTFCDLTKCLNTAKTVPWGRSHEIPPLYRMWRTVTMSARAHHWSSTSARRIYSTSLFCVLWRFISCL